jgi:eukaryotic-like serine/threonine-protein kinase
VPARRLGKYEVLARLATGGMSNIFLARQIGAAGFHKLVVLKMLLPERAKEADYVAMFLDEAKLAARLQHPNCVEVYDLGRVASSYYMAMEFILGSPITALIGAAARGGKTIPPQVVAFVLSQAADGLHHAHELTDAHGRPFRLVHRDVSPSNIMVTFDGQAKVLDFGVAKAKTARAPTEAGIIKGKLGYMSPEHVMGQPVDRRSDVYALGVVLYEMFSLRRLFRGTLPEQIAEVIVRGHVPRISEVVPDVPRELDAICTRALAREASGRFQTALEMANALRAYLGNTRTSHLQAATQTAIEDLLKDRVRARKDACEAALQGRYDEAKLLEAFGAYPLRDIDIPEDSPEPSISMLLDVMERGPPQDDPAERNGPDASLDVDISVDMPMPGPTAREPIPQSPMGPSGPHVRVDPDQTRLDPVETVTEADEEREPDVEPTHVDTDDEDALSGGGAGIVTDSDLIPKPVSGEMTPIDPYLDSDAQVDLSTLRARDGLRGDGSQTIRAEPDDIRTPAGPVTTPIAPSAGASASARLLTILVAGIILGLLMGLLVAVSFLGAQDPLSALRQAFSR